MWLILAFCSAVLLGFYDVSKKQSLGGNAVIPVLTLNTLFSTLVFLPFILLSDPEREAIEAYDVWQEKKMYGKTSMGVVRTTYIINEEGIIEKVFEKAKPDTNAAEILEDLAQA